MSHDFLFKIGDELINHRQLYDAPPIINEVIGISEKPDIANSNYFVYYIKRSTCKDGIYMYYPYSHRFEFYNTENQLYHTFHNYKLIDFKKFKNNMIDNLCENKIDNFHTASQIIRNYKHTFTALDKILIIKYYSRLFYLLEFIDDSLGFYEFEFLIEYYLSHAVIEYLNTESEFVNNNREWFNKFVNKMKLKYGYNNFHNIVIPNPVSRLNANEKYIKPCYTNI